MLSQEFKRFLNTVDTIPAHFHVIMHPLADKMNVRVIEAGNHGLAAQIDNFRRTSRQGADIRRTACRSNRIARNRKGLFDAICTIDSCDLTVEQDDVRLCRSRCSGARAGGKKTSFGTMPEPSAAAVAAAPLINSLRLVFLFGLNIC